MEPDDQSWELAFNAQEANIKADGALAFAAKWIAPAGSLEGAGQQPAS